MTITIEDGQYIFRYFDVIIKKGSKLQVEKAVNKLLINGEKKAQKKLNLLIYGTRVPRFLKGMISHLKYGDVSIEVIARGPNSGRGRVVVEAYKYVIGKGGRLASNFADNFQPVLKKFSGIHVYKYIDDIFREVTEVLETKILPNGDLVDIVRLKVFVKEKISGWSGTVRKTMFPKNWSDLKIERVLKEASENLIFKKGDRFIGVAKNGTQIEFRYDRVRKGMKNAFITFENIN